MKKYYKKYGFILLVAVVSFCAPAFGQVSYLINMAPVDGIELTPDNMFNFSVQQNGNKATNVLIKGNIRFRNSQMSFSYSFKSTLQPGINSFNSNIVHPQWQFSTTDLQNLFLSQKSLPAGTYEYCISITPTSLNGEVDPTESNECVYHTDNETFLINLIDPEDKAKSHEYYPMFSWMANYSRSNELTYRIRIAEIKKGQNAANAVLRNQPVYSQSGLFSNSIVYPQYGKPLVKNQPYAWAVDAYYKSLLLGGSETWQFIILDDTLAAKLTPDRSYLDIRLEKGSSQLYAVGELKLKYVLEETRTDILSLQLFDGDRQIAMVPNTLAAKYGDNRFVVDLREKTVLKHLRDYRLVLTSETGSVYTMLFRYFNPDYTQN